MENVPLLLSKKHIGNFQLWRRKLEQLGYSNFVQLLNSKDYGIPQNRNRCFMVSILGDWSYTFPKKQKLELKLKDMLEDQVDEKYYLSDETIKFFVINNKKNELAGNGFRFEPIERERERVGKTVQPKMNRPEVDYLMESGGGSSKEEQESTNRMKCSTGKMKHLERSQAAITNHRSRLSKAIRSGGRGSIDRHNWDVICEEEIL